MHLTLAGLRDKVDGGAIDTVIIAGTDMQGRLYGKRLTARHFLAAGHSGISTCSVVLGWGQDHSLDPGYRFTGWETGYPDFISRPDLDTMRLCAWHPRTAIVLADAVGLDGAPVPVAPRALLQRQIERARALGFEPFTASELEFFLLRESADSVHAKGFVNLETRHRTMHPETVIRTSEDESYAHALRAALEGSAIPVEMVKAEYSPGQIELNLAYAAALDSADRHVLMKTAAKEVALAQGMAATFMAKWHHDFGGSSCHTHFSMLRRDGGSAFDNGHGEPNETMLHFLGGLLRYAPDFFLFFAPTTNAYKRLLPNTFAPCRLTWGRDNRTVAFRVIGSGPALRVENRLPGADVNPYLVYAGMLAAGLAGIEGRIRPPATASSGNTYQQDQGAPVPASLDESAELFARSEAVARSLGTEAQSHYANFGRQTSAAFRRLVTDAERRLLLLDI